MVSPPSWSQRKIPRRNNISLTTDHLTPSPERMSPPYQTLPNVLKAYKGWNYLANSTYNGDTIISALKKKTSGKERSKYIKDYSNQK